ncbi:hypothetical protein ACLI1A_18220 [Flavobacterium sp. RHBU_3]|uniref:hypothetical protein n=1 Tax=Flavobacterium sp. RHBU_3 TaxID=3391184 RepID=UPI003985205B
MRDSSAIDILIEKLSLYPAIKLERVNEVCLKIYGDETGYDFELHEGLKEYLLYFGNSHGHYNKAQDVQEMLRDIFFGLSGVSRIKEVLKDGKHYEWVTQSQDSEGNWFDNEKVSILGFSFWRKSAPVIEERYYQNNLLPKEVALAWCK